MVINVFPGFVSQFHRLVCILLRLQQVQLNASQWRWGVHGVMARHRAKTVETAGYGMMPAADFKLAAANTHPVRNVSRAVQTIAITSGKGGVGKTNIAANLALLLAGDGLPTMLLDADLGMANVDALLGIHAPANLMHVLAGDSRLDEIILNGPYGLMIIPAASGSKQLAELGPLECAGLVRAFSELDRDIDTLLIDTATGISESVASLCAASGNVLVVANNEPTSIRDSVALIKLLNSRNTTAYIHVLANMAPNAREGDEIFQNILDSLPDMQNMIISYAGCIPYDDALRRSAASRKAVVTAYPNSISAEALRRLGKQLRRWPRAQYPNGRLEFFVERLFQHKNVEMEVMS